MCVGFSLKEVIQRKIGNFQAAKIQYPSLANPVE